MAPLIVAVPFALACEFGLLDAVWHITAAALHVQGLSQGTTARYAWAATVTVGAVLLWINVTQVLKRIRRRQVKVDGDGVTQTGPGARTAQLLWQAVDGCRIERTTTLAGLETDAELASELVVSGAGKTIRIWKSMQGYAEARRAILARTPVATAWDLSQRWSRARILAWLAIAIILIAGAGAVVWYALKWL